MSTNINRAKLNKAQNGGQYRIKLINDFYPIYWDEGTTYYGNKMSYQVRMYRTWKHYRKTQYKVIT
jgi:hypothetical protein